MLTHCNKQKNIPDIIDVADILSLKNIHIVQTLKQTHIDQSLLCMIDRLHNVRRRVTLL